MTVHKESEISLCLVLGSHRATRIVRSPGYNN
jgi:hypothetical protein